MRPAGYFSIIQLSNSRALAINHFGGIGFTIGKVSINLSGLAVASILGIVLNVVLPGNNYTFEMAQKN